MTPAGTLAATAFFLAAVYCALDPLRHSPIHGFPDFEVVKLDLPPWSEIPRYTDPEDRLQRSEILFRGEVQGPESMAFDPRGRGPYTGVADGRIVFWNGEAWTDFAYTSPRR